MTERAALYMHDSTSQSVLTVRTGDEALTVSVQHGQIAVAMPLRRDDVRALIATLDDWLYDSRPS